VESAFARLDVVDAYYRPRHAVDDSNNLRQGRDAVENSAVNACPSQLNVSVHPTGVHQGSKDAAYT
jgi:hypothetical protein